MIESLQPFAIALFIGLLIGIERERSHPVGLKAMGVRTFILLALLGTLAATIQQPTLSIVVAMFAFGAILLSYWRSSTARQEHAEIGITTEFSAAVVFCLGFITPQEPLLAAILGAAVLFILLSRARLHNFSRNQLKPEEIRAATTILVIMVGILPFLPNHSIDPWQLFNPQRFGILVLVLAVIQFGGYVAMRVLGERLGILLTGFFGGLVSSTAVFTTLPRFSREHPELTRVTVAAALLATVAKLIEFTLIIAIAAPALLKMIIAPLITMATVGVLLAFLMTYDNGAKKIIAHHPINPLDVRSILRLACFIGGMVFLIGLAQFYFGARGIQLLAFLGGLVQLHSVTYAAATLYTTGKLIANITCVTLLLALLASFITKFILVWTLARNRFALLTSVFLLLMLAAGGATYFYMA
jgi:uncharacterized membrane protein (DUF4010 family)